MIFHQSVPASMAALPGRQVAPNREPDDELTPHEKRMKQMREYTPAWRARRKLTVSQYGV